MIWVTGAKGMLGTELCLMLSQRGISNIGSGSEIDIRNPESIESFALGRNIRTIVNCAAYTAVDKAEDERETALGINADGPANLARWAAANDASLIHISTDYVFDGKGILGLGGERRAYLEDDPTGPVSVYGLSKLAGEKLAMELCSASYVLRTSWLYGAYGPNFVATMLRLMKERDTLGVVADQTGSPTWTRDLANVIIMLTQSKEVPPGIYHVSNNGKTNWHEFASAIFRRAFDVGLLTKAVTINALSTAQYPTKAPRPAWSLLSKAKIERSLGISIPSWEKSLDLFLSAMVSDRPA